jgi:salicylate hydroxylase
MAQQRAQRPLKVAIIGAGIGGLAAASALRQRGIEVELFERSSKLEEVGAGVQIGPNGVKVFRALGLEDELHRNAFEPINMVSLKWDDASIRHREPLKAIATAQYGAPYMTAHRADIHGMLRAAVADVPLRLGVNCMAPRR